MFFESLIKHAAYVTEWDSIPTHLQLPYFDSMVRDFADDRKKNLNDLYGQHTWDQLQKLVSSDQNAAFMHVQYLHIASRQVWQNHVSLANKIKSF